MPIQIGAMKGNRWHAPLQRATTLVLCEAHRLRRRLARETQLAPPDCVSEPQSKELRLAATAPTRYLPRSSRLSQARARLHLLFTVAGETPTTSAVSSMLRPPKKRSSTIRAC